jgi:hypothetical protein
MNMSRNIKGVYGRRRWYKGYVDTPDKRMGFYKLVIVLQPSFIRTFLGLLHELTHILINLIYGEEETGNKIHNYFDHISTKIEMFWDRG